MFLEVDVHVLVESGLLELIAGAADGGITQMPSTFCFWSWMKKKYFQSLKWGGIPR